MYKDPKVQLLRCDRGDWGVLHLGQFYYYHLENQGVVKAKSEDPNHPPGTEISFPLSKTISYSWINQERYFIS